MEKQRAQMWEQSNELINNKRDKPAFLLLRQQKWKLHQDVEVLLLTAKWFIKGHEVYFTQFIEKNGKIKYGVSVSNQWKIAQFKGVTSKLSSRNVA